jgi:GH35 family endo-1,4-beta-xylanase
LDRKYLLKQFFVTMTALAVIGTIATTVHAQAGFPDSLRKYSDTKVVPFHIGTAVTRHGGPSLYPPNGYQPGLLTDSVQDQAYQALVRGQFNQIEAGNGTKMMSLWTGGASRVNGHYVVKTNLFDASGPLSQLCTWAEAQRPHLTVRGHCMVYNQDYTLPTFPAGQPPLFVRDATGKQILNTSYTPNDVRDMLQSYVQQVVDATMAQNAASRTRHGYKVIEMWDVTNEVVSEDAHDAVPSGLGFAYRQMDPWYHAGPENTAGVSGYDYIADIYHWASQEMTQDIGKTIAGQKITKADRFELYYNEYNLEWNASKMASVLNLIKHARQSSGEVDGLGFQAHIEANGLDTQQFNASIMGAIANKLRFSVTELDCAIHPPTRAGEPTVAQQEINQGTEYGQVTALCVKYQKSCDALQIWGATDDGSWLPNQEATPVTRWVIDTRSGPTKGKLGYWPKEGQYDPETLFDPITGMLNPNSGHTISNAYDAMIAALSKTNP